MKKRKLGPRLIVRVHSFVLLCSRPLGRSHRTPDRALSLDVHLYHRTYHHSKAYQ